MDPRYKWIRTQDGKIIRFDTVTGFFTFSPSDEPGLFLLCCNIEGVDRARKLAEVASMEEGETLSMDILTHLAATDVMIYDLRVIANEKRAAARAAAKAEKAASSPASTKPAPKRSRKKKATSNV